MNYSGNCVGNINLQICVTLCPGIHISSDFVSTITSDAENEI